jgi:hypothetical protein
MCCLPKFALAACILLCGSWQMQGQVSPIPIRGGDIIPPFISQFLPGPGGGFDGLNAEPHGITNFSGVVAMGYTSGTDTMALTTVTFPASVGARDEEATLALNWHLHWRNVQLQFRNYDSRVFRGRPLKMLSAIPIRLC